MRSYLASFIIGVSVLSISSCGIIGSAMTPTTRNVALPDGPPVEEIITNFDEALVCLRGHIPEEITFGAGQVVDATGRESYAEGSTGRFVSQGAAEMVQSAMFRAGASVVNRRDPQILVTETQWGIRDIQRQIPVNFFISGSINSLDFIPGGGGSVEIGGVGPRYRQSRILIGLDLSLTDAFTGRILASVPLQRQIFSREVGFSAGRFFGDTLLSLDAGGQEREAVHFVLRQMLNLATFELLGQLVPENQYRECRVLIEPFTGRIETQRSATDNFIRTAMSTASEGGAQTQAGAPAAQPRAAVSAGQPSADETRIAAAASVDGQIKALVDRATIAAVRAISAAAEAKGSDSSNRAAKTAEAVQLARAAMQQLQRAAELGLSGAEGDAAAVVVQRAMEDAMDVYAEIQAETPQSPALEEPLEQALPPDDASPSGPPPHANAIPGGPGALTQPSPMIAPSLDGANGSQDTELLFGSP